MDDVISQKLICLINENLLSLAAVMRSARLRGFEQKDLQKLADLSHYIKQSHQCRHIRYAWKHERVAARPRTANSHIAHGLIILNMKGTVLNADAGAEAIFEEPNGLKLCNGRLILKAGTSPLAADGLQAFVQTTAHHAGPFIIKPCDGTLIVLEHLPVPGSNAHTQEQLCRFITLKRIRTKIAPATTTISKAFGLTKAEARVADALSSSDNASKAARTLGITRDTMKSHLNKIYGKTGVNSLPQLMLLIGKLS